MYKTSGFEQLQISTIQVPKHVSMLKHMWNQCTLQACRAVSCKELISPVEKKLPANQMFETKITKRT